MCRTMKELENAIADYRSLKAMKEQLEEELKAVEREIIGYLDSNEKLTETGNDFTVKISTCERRTVDTKRLEADLGSLAEYQRISQYRRLYIR
jgi:predicted phage-related endonuclease